MVVYAQSLDHVRLFVTLWTVAHQTPLSMKFSKQEYRSGLPTPGYLPNPGVASSALAGGFFTTEPPGKQVVAVVIPNKGMSTPYLLVWLKQVIFLAEISLVLFRGENVNI